MKRSEIDAGAGRSDLVPTRAEQLNENFFRSQQEVIEWAQAALTVLNVSDIKSGSLIHLKLREVMIAYRESKQQAHK